MNYPDLWLPDGVCISAPRSFHTAGKPITISFFIMSNKNSLQRKGYTIPQLSWFPLFIAPIQAKGLASGLVGGSRDISLVGL